MTNTFASDRIEVMRVYWFARVPFSDPLYIFDHELFLLQIK